MILNIKARLAHKTDKYIVFTTDHDTNTDKSYWHHFWISSQDIFKVWRKEKADHHFECDCEECCEIVKPEEGFVYYLTLNTWEDKEKQQTRLYLNRVNKVYGKGPHALGFCSVNNVRITQINPMNPEEGFWITRLRVHDIKGNRYFYLWHKSEKCPDFTLYATCDFKCRLFNKSRYDENGKPLQIKEELYTDREGMEWNKMYSELLIEEIKVRELPDEETGRGMKVIENNAPQSRFKKRR